MCRNLNVGNSLHNYTLTPTPPQYGGSSFGPTIEILNDGDDDATVPTSNLASDRAPRLLPPAMGTDKQQSCRMRMRPGRVGPTEARTGYPQVRPGPLTELTQQSRPVSPGQEARNNFAQGSGGSSDGAQVPTTGILNEAVASPFRGRHACVPEGCPFLRHQDQDTRPPSPTLVLDVGLHARASERRSCSQNSLGLHAGAGEGRSRSQNSKSATALAKAWQHLVNTRILPRDEYRNAMFNTGKIKIAVDMAIADAGATSHFIVAGAPLLNKQPAKNPLHIHLPDGDTLKSLHTCDLDVPALPKAARAAHIVPG